jgi:Amt family ammonium transporter
VTNLGAAAGVIMASITISLISKKLDVGMAGNGAIAGLVAITAPSGYVEFWAAPIIGGVAGVLVVLAVLAIDKKVDDPVGALSPRTASRASGARWPAACSPRRGWPRPSAS